MLAYYKVLLVFHQSQSVGITKTWVRDNVILRYSVGQIIEKFN